MLQAGNCAMWLAHAYSPFLPLGAQFPLMVFVGLLGGAMASDVIGHAVIDNELQLRRPMYAGTVIVGRFLGRRPT